MIGRLQVPDLSDLEDLGIDVERGEEPWQVYLKVQAKDGSRVELSWDELTASVSVSLHEGEREILSIYREEIRSMPVNRNRGCLYFSVETYSERRKDAALAGTLLIEVGERVSVSDTLLIR